MSKTTMQGITEMAMAQAIGTGIFYAPTSERDTYVGRMNRVVNWATRRYGAEWAFPRYLALGQLSIDTAMRTLYSEEAFTAAYTRDAQEVAIA